MSRKNAMKKEKDEKNRSRVSCGEKLRFVAFAGHTLFHNEHDDADHGHDSKPNNGGGVHT